MMLLTTPAILWPDSQVFYVTTEQIHAWTRGPRRNAAAALLALTAIHFTRVPALSQREQDRFRLPIDAILFMFAAWGVRALAQRWMPGAPGSREPAPQP